MTAPLLFFVPTPIGNLNDISQRALATLREVDTIVVEDSRRTAKLLAHYNIEAPLLIYHDHNEAWAAEQIIALLRNGKKVALVTDGGTPGVSDPGHTIIQRAIAEEIPFTALPGANAVLPALLLSGLPFHNFLFLGFLPRRGAARAAARRRIAFAEETVVIYESPKRLHRTIDELAALFPGRRAAVVREISKVFEETTRFCLGDTVAVQARGEVVLVIAGRDAGAAGFSDMTVADQLMELERLGLPRRDALKAVAADRRMAKSDMYRLVEKMKNRQ